MRTLITLSVLAAVLTAAVTPSVAFDPKKFRAFEQAQHD